MRICSWNIQFGSRLDAVLDAVRDEPSFRDVDVIALQEASVHDGLPDAAAIAERMGWGFSYFQASAQRRRGLEQANALVWRRSALEAVERFDILPLRATPVTAGHSERLLLRVLRPQRRMAVRVEASTTRIYVVHLDLVGFTHKLEQFGAVLADMEARPRAALTVVAGDLNTFGPVRPHLWRRLASAADTAGLVNLTAEIRRTHWTGQRLDAIYASSRAPISHRSWTVAVHASDHLPVFADIEAVA